MLGVPPQPPPPNVPPLEEGAGDGRVLSLRERMEQHRANPACAGCHKVMDPIGFALENFDGDRPLARTTEDGVASTRPARSSTARRSMASPGCAAKLVAQPEIFVGVMTEKLLTYALGRGLEYYDMPAVRRSSRDAGSERTIDFRRSCWAS